MDASEILRLALAFFLVVTGLALAFLLWRMAQLFRSLSATVERSTDEVVPILSKAQLTMDGVNQEIGRVDEIMVSAVGATKGAEKAVATVSTGVTAPIRKLSGIAAGLQEAAGTFRSRMAADAASRAQARPPDPAPAPAAPKPPDVTPPTPPKAPPAPPKTTATEPAVAEKASAPPEKTPQPSTAPATPRSTTSATAESAPESATADSGPGGRWAAARAQRARSAADSSRALWKD